MGGARDVGPYAPAVLLPLVAVGDRGPTPRAVGGRQGRARVWVAGDPRWNAVGRRKRQACDRVRVPFGKPHRAVRRDSDVMDPGSGCDAGAELRDRPARSDAGDAVGAGLTEPQGARAGDDFVGSGTRRDAGGELGDYPARGDAPDLVGAWLGEPQIPIGPGRDVLWRGTGRDARLELGDDAGRRDPPDGACPGIGEPERAVRPGHDPAQA